MDDAWNELTFDFEPAVEDALPASALANTRDNRFRTQVSNKGSPILKVDSPVDASPSALSGMMYDVYDRSRSRNALHLCYYYCANGTRAPREGVSDAWSCSWLVLVCDLS